eukprot:gnl/MRDRNA2_/MRDRNA2_149653_c0_seq1.p1 gnl/MRDRNA2_/MRDRNA2_149653_c0~~gnl/MRDRNA2_/MRDRNA2_149653_c0_seq1.p1  ORF type:complete len:471 (-),score=90.75 gnl/MRDRNA2_/MRDRNA2_149653_c0_seq1:181-1410(-)
MPAPVGSPARTDCDEVSTSVTSADDAPQSDEAPSYQDSVFSEDVCFPWDDLKRCQDLASKLSTEDGAARKQILSTLGKSALHLAFSADGAEVLQGALEVACCGEEQESLMGGLRGHVRELASVPAGSEVLQSCVELMPPQACRFIIEESRGVLAVMACSEGGKELILRLLEHLPAQESAPVTEELLQDMAQLGWHPCGSQIMQHMLEYGSPVQQMRICEALMASQASCPPHQNACEVVQRALECVSPDVRAQLKKVVLRPTDDEAEGLDDFMPPESTLDADAVPFNPNVEVTTLMIRGIPCSLSQERLMLFLDQAGLRCKYDFFYMPRAGRSRSNLGYAFVNFVDSASSALACSCAQGVALDPGRSKKVCTVTPAHIQGLEELKRHFRKTAVSRGTRGPVYLGAGLPQA